VTPGEGRVSRRAFIAAGATAAVGLSGPRLGRSVAGQKTQVVVIGAGLAGLTCTLRLQQRGIDVRVVEAQERVGGRCFTARGFPGGAIAEHGGEFIDTRHVHMRRLVAEMGLRLEDRFSVDDGATAYWLAGARRTPAEVFAGADVLENRVARIAAEVDGDPAALRTLDERSLEDALAQIVPGGMTSLLGIATGLTIETEYGRAPRELSGAILLDEATSGANADERFHVRGGNDRVVRALANRVGERRISRGRPVVAILSRSDGRQAVELDGAGQIIADAVVIAIPFPALRDVDLDRLAIPAWRRAAIAELGMGTNAKLLLPLTRGAGEKRIAGDTVSDDPRGVTWDSTVAQGAQGQLLTVFSGGATGAADPTTPAHAPAPQDVVDAAAARLGLVRPGLRERVAPGAWRDVWTRDRWTKGSYAAFLPGQVTRFGGRLSRAHGGVIFAGEHTSPISQGYLDGAVESGERAARQVTLHLTGAGHGR
jgi:monoamine oxidase